jgi:uncharacterized OsmC-like protein
MLLIFMARKLGISKFKVRKVSFMVEDISFHNQVTWTEGAKGEIAFSLGSKVEFALPAEFGGIEGFPSPEDFFVAAANACVLTTTITRAKKYNVALRSCRPEAVGVLEKVAGGREATKIEIKARLAAGGEPEAIKKMIAEHKGRVPVIRSMKTLVSIDFEVKQQ